MHTLINVCIQHENIKWAEFLEESSFYYFNDVIDYIWQKIKK